MLVTLSGVAPMLAIFGASHSVNEVVDVKPAPTYTRSYAYVIKIEALNI